MSCLINRNEKGNIIQVSTPEGNRSELFDKIHANVFLGDAETSVKLMTASLSPSIQKTFANTEENKYSSGEPRLFYRGINGKTYESLEQLLIDTSTSGHGDVSMGFINPATGFFIPFAKFSTESGEKTKFITSQILEGTLSEERVLGSDGITRFQGKGEFLDTKIAMSVLLKNNAKNDLAMGNVAIDKQTGTVTLESAGNTILTENANGTYSFVEISEIDARANEFENSSELKATNDYIKGKYRSTSPKTKVTVQTSNSAIARALQNFLQSLGFTQMSLEAYRKRYNTLYGKDPDIQALADISNRVVAYANGQVSIDRLSEEVAHIAIEAYSDQNSIVSALATVHLTPEYAQYSEYYRSKYAPFFQDVALEDQVRKEILGKILANEFINRFNAEGQSTERQALIEKLKTIFKAVIDYISARLKPYHVRSLNDLNKKIADNLINNNLAEFKYDLSGSNRFFYSAMSEKHRELQQGLMRAKKVLEDLANAQGRANPDRYALEQIQEGMTEINLVSSANTIVGITDRKISELDRELKSLTPVNGRPGTLSVAGENIASNLRMNLIPLISSIEFSLKALAAETQVTDPILKAQIKNTVANLSESVNTLTNRFRELDQLVNKDMDTVAEMIFEDNYDRKVMTEEVYKNEKEKFLGRVRTTMKDYGFIGRMFGLLSESRNPVLQLIGARVQQMQMAIRMKFTESSTDTILKILNNGGQKFEKSIIKTDANGKTTHYIWGPADYARYDAERLAKKTEILAGIAEKSPEEITTLLKKYTVYEILKDSAEKIQAYNNQLKDWADSRQQKQFLPEYYQQQKDRFANHKISEATQETIKNFSARAAEINRLHRNAAGQVDKSTMTEADIEALNRIKKERELVKSPYDRANEVRVGLKIVKVSELTAEELGSLTYEPSADYKGDLVVIADGFDLESLPEESRVSLDMHNLGYAYQFDKQKEVATASDEFIGTILKMETQAALGQITYEDVFNWVNDNSTMSLSDSYYNSLDVSKTYESSVLSYIGTLPDPIARQNLAVLLDQHKKLSTVRKYLLKQNKKIGSSLDVNVHAMDDKTRLKLLEIEEDLNLVRKKIALPEEFKSAMSAEDTTIQLTEDFYKMAKEAGLSEEGDLFTFALRHMSHSKKRMAEDFSTQLYELLNENRIMMKGMYEEFLDTLTAEGRINDTMTKEQLMRIAKDEFAKANVASYFKKFLPSTFNQAVADLKTGRVLLSDVVQGKATDQIVGLENIAINPDYTWTQTISASNLLNPNYKKGEYYLQLNDDYLDKTWFDHFGINIEDYKKMATDDLSMLTPTKNKEEFEYLQAYMKLREMSLENYGDTDRVNKWQRVQISKTEFEKYSSANAILNLANYTKDSVREFTQNRLDEKAYGEELDGINLIQEGSQASVRSIPKYFQRQLEDPNVVSENTLSSVLLDLKESIVYGERVRADRDVRALMHQITKQNFVGSGVSMKGRVITKPGQVSAMMEKAKEYVDHHLYGVQQSRPLFLSVNGKEVDFTKIINSVQKFARFSNLAGNLFVDVTGATTGFLNNVVDRYAGDYYHKSSVNRANSQATSMMLAHLKEKEIDNSLARTTKLGQIMEMLGIDDPSERVRESNSGKGKRFVKNLPYLGSRISNMTLSPKIALATLNDMRFYKENFFSFENFVHIRTVENNGDLTLKDIETEWNTLKEESLFDHLDFTKSTLTFNDKFKNRFENPQEEFTKLMTKAAQKAQKIIMNSDMVINDADRVAAQRDILTNTLLMHRGWMVISLTKRFKSQFYNLSTGKYEQGQYITLLNFLGSILGTVRGKGNFSEVLNNLDRNQKQNLVRVAVETALLVAILALGESVLEGDDDDDTVLENFMQLIYLRTASEFNSSTIIGIPGSIVEFADAPIPAINTYKMFNLMKTVPDMFSEDKEGRNKFLKSVKKNSILRRYDQYSDLQTQIDAYRYYNDPTLLNLGSVGESKEKDAAAANERAINSLRLN